MQDIIRAIWPEVPVSCSVDLAPVIGEYERSATVVVNAYVAPRVVPYLRRLDAELTAMGLGRGLLLVQSNGGAISVAELNDQAVQLILSGPRPAAARSAISVAIPAPPTWWRSKSAARVATSPCRPVVRSP